MAADQPSTTSAKVSSPERAFAVTAHGDHVYPTPEHVDELGMLRRRLDAMGDLYATLTERVMRLEGK